MKLFSVPNLITLGNLLCGCLAIVFAFDGQLVLSAYLVGIAAVLDFFDGFVARLLNQHSPIGKELDSLADCVTFGVVPGIVLFKLLELSAYIKYQSMLAYTDFAGGTPVFEKPWWVWIAFLIPLFSALRLAKFNIDTRQSESFVGVPTPANSILICSFPLILHAVPGADLSALTGYEAWFLNPIVLIAVAVVMSYLLIAEIPLFALKFKSFGWAGNEIRWTFLLASVLLLVLLQYAGLPLIIILYVLMSVVNNLMKPKSNS
ncbi:MAG: CDP-alcohol phosphatidyltransferase family protein [Bacteroidia bacterium]